MTLNVFSSDLLEGLISKAHESPRKRQHLNIHQNYEDSCQRFFNAIGTESYIRPHRHSLDPKTETIIAIRGLFGLVMFDDHGAIRRIERFGTESLCGNAGVEVAPGTWHTVVALTDAAVMLEVKAGPFRANAAKEPAPWAPEEDGAEAMNYLRFLRGAITAIESKSSVLK